MTLPQWLPPTAAAHFDFEHGNFYDAGTVQTVNYFTNNNDGSLTISYGSTPSWWNSGNYTVVVDYQNSFLVDPNACFFSWGNASAHRFEVIAWPIQTIEAAPGDAFPYPVLWVNFYAKAGASATYGNVIGDLNCPIQTGKGRNRLTLSCSLATGNVYARWNNAPATLQWNGFSGFTTPTFVNIYRGALNQLLATGGQVYRITIYPFADVPGGANFEGPALFGAVCPPIHFLGNSFLNDGLLVDQVRLLTASKGYVPYSQDGVGGTTFAQECARYAGYTAPETRWYNSTLVMPVGGQNGSFTSGSLPTLASTLALMTYPQRFFLSQANPSSVGNTSWASGEALMQAALQPINASAYIPTLATMQAANNGSAADLLAVSEGLWPPSLLSDTVHPNDAGRIPLAQGMYSVLKQQGLIV